MTREEASRILDPETSRDELWKYEADTRIEACNEACRMGADALRAQKEREHPMTNADRIRAMSDEELAEFIQNMVDGSNSHNVACYGCINYGTHHSDPANKGTCLYECDGCENEGIGLDVLKWLQQPAEEDDHA